MRLLNIHTLKLENFLGDVPPYAILSHTWGNGEVTLQDMDRGDLDKKPGWAKIVGFCKAVVKLFPEPLEYVWVDTCCIDKTSSAELSEAINAMFRWYQLAQCCFAYLEDVSHSASGSVGDEFEASRWFTRGWTLQELLAPRAVDFFDRNWNFLGSRSELAERISTTTGVDEETLLGGDLSLASVAQRMSWAADRQTTRLEDMAYCLLGIFNISMTMLYGEGESAFIRLQEEIIKEYDDQSIFAWDASTVPESISTIGILATHPRFFKDCASFEAHPSQGHIVVTNRGVQIDLPLIRFERDMLGVSAPELARE
ncbi:heterokaryon incompatibility protein-domain-containing protein [Ilyonectria robusta]|uniref:heterokaryon incompatibility protein-domain-containing protein n=1 Tax=Ilyonectria robusta TaxID=1079257 RepID=UPI001E8D6794|nr:heterokaryon incompatibility protein-domain-containing protein [Ilyonectria robusta]KAH8651658.1 heterokaryon incompatibility protein-domain-containing protein [Ilyonectria robusta]